MTKPRTRFYADENIESNLVCHLRAQGFHVDYAVNLGFSKRDDSFHLQEARRRKCVLLSKDRGYLDHHRFPFQDLVDTAIIVIKTAYSGADIINLGHMLVSLVDVVGPSGNKNIHGLKMDIKGPATTLFARVNGRIMSDVFELGDPDRDLFTEQKTANPHMRAVGKG
jgi:hypothetical protein